MVSRHGGSKGYWVWRAQKSPLNGSSLGGRAGRSCVHGGSVYGVEAFAELSQLVPQRSDLVLSIWARGFDR